MKKETWEDIYINYAKNNTNPYYDHRLWNWLKENYKPAIKIIKNEKQKQKTTTTGIEQ